MKDMIEKIISTDKKSREAMAKTRQLKVESEQKISDMCEKKRSEYIERARVNIRNMEKQERIKAEIKLKKIEGEYQNLSQRIDRIYSDNCDMWVDEIVKRVIDV